MSPSLIPKPVQIPSFMCGGITVIALCEFNDKKKKKKEQHAQNAEIKFCPKNGNLKYVLH